MKKRSFKKGDNVCVIDYWGTENGTQAFAVGAEIIKVSRKARTFTAVLYGDTYQTYSFDDYGRLIFDNSIEALEEINKLPKPKDKVYQVINKRIFRKRVVGITQDIESKTFDLAVNLNRGKPVSINEIGKTLFLSEDAARSTI